ncbi:MAG: DUF3996 domain-containing protein [Myxococcales bacterium]|nr:DUF3996 domain-containing protein [Myxococcales bacterium]
MNITRLLCTAAFVTALGVTAPAHATEVGNARTFGLGFGLGSPNSLVGKVFLGPGQALDFGIGVSRYGWGRCWNGDGYVRCRDGFSDVGINVDYLWQENLVYSKVTLDWHIGAGGRIWIIDQDRFDNNSNDSVALAGRMPVGLDLMFSRPSFLEVFAEIAPTLYVVPGVGLDFEGLLGARFYF